MSNPTELQFLNAYAVLTTADRQAVDAACAELEARGMLPCDALEAVAAVGRWLVGDAEAQAVDALEAASAAVLRKVIAEGRATELLTDLGGCSVRKHRYERLETNVFQVVNE